MSKIGMIGDKSSVMGFGAIGLTTAFCKTADETKKALDSMAECCAVFTTERLYAELMQTSVLSAEGLTPAVVPIPDRSGGIGLGDRLMQDRIKRAIGVNLPEKVE